jgi:hypothetical protein
MSVEVWSRNSTFSPRIFASVNYPTSACARGMFADPYRNEPFRESNERTCQPPNTSTAGESSSIDNTAVQLSGFCLDMTVLQIEYHTLLTFYLRLSSTSLYEGATHEEVIHEEISGTAHRDQEEEKVGTLDLFQCRWLRHTTIHNLTCPSMAQGCFGILLTCQRS